MNNGLYPGSVTDRLQSQFIGQVPKTTYRDGTTGVNSKGTYNYKDGLWKGIGSIQAGGAATLNLVGYYGLGGVNNPEIRDPFNKVNEAFGVGYDGDLSKTSLSFDVDGGSCAGGGGGGGGGTGIVKTFDLALTKIISGSTMIKSGDIREFIITIYNQGTITGSDIDVIDYIPFGLSFISGGYNTGWILSGTKTTGYTTAETTYFTGIGPGKTGQLSIRLLVNGDQLSGTIRNYAEIIESYNGGYYDVDSTGDRNKFNDCEGFDNQLTGTGPGSNGICDPGEDEDDHDRVDIYPGWFDLALKKTIATGTTLPIYSGQTITFTITVLNQGSLDAQDIQLVDYIPAGLTLADPSWTLSGTMAFKTLTGILTPNLSFGPSTFTSTTITFLVNGTITGTITNRSEIKTASGGTDIDSTPDMINGAHIESPIGQNDIVDQQPPIDEDDHDWEDISVTSTPYDMWIDKKLTTTGILQSGSTIHYTIEYSITGATKVCTITDVYDTHHIFSGSNPVYSIHNPTTKTVIWSGITLIPGSTGVIDVWFILQGTGSFINNVSITCGGDDTIQTNNTGSDGGFIGRFDLALTKILSGNQTTGYVSGNSVTFTITVFNQGTIPASTIQIIDYIPVGLTLTDPSWTLSGGNAVKILSGSLAPGAFTTTPITFVVNGSASG
ncbi:MAG TPA: hypothetical protein PLW93_04625, partial [Candidatus Absconditabacterales bacterium]|nr:hypothetical protein [Candidatus Absconditabacterales bacterium]